MKRSNGSKKKAAREHVARKFPPLDGSGVQRMHPRSPADRRKQALHALNCAIACMVAWPPSDEHLGGAVYFTTLALYRMAQADPDGAAAACAEQYLEQTRRAKTGALVVAAEESP